MPDPRRLIIFSAVQHRVGHEGVWGAQPGAGLRAHSGFVREVDLWASIFRQVVVIAPFSNKPPLSDEIIYERENVTVIPLGSELVTRGTTGKVRLALALPARVWRAARVLRREDVVMARGPESAGFLGYLLTRGRSTTRFAKYVDQWDAVPGERLQYRLQKAAYRSPSFGGAVMIYGKPDPARPHLVPFFTSSVSRAEWETAGAWIARREADAPDKPFRLLFVGRFLHFKGVDVLLNAVRRVQDVGEAVTLDIVGEGDLRDSLQAQCRALGLDPITTWHGWLGWEALAAQYARADALIHSSRKEGYGKVLLEGMTFALPIIGTDVGVSQAIVEPPRCGVLVAPDNVQGLADGILQLARNRGEAQAMGGRGREKARGLLLEDLEAQYRTFVRDHLASVGGQA